MYRKGLALSGNCTWTASLGNSNMDTTDLFFSSWLSMRKFYIITLCLNAMQRNKRRDENKIQSFCISGALVCVLRFPGHPQDQKALSDLRNWLEKQNSKTVKYWSSALKPGTIWEPYIAHFPCKYKNHIARFKQFVFLVFLFLWAWPKKEKTPLFVIHRQRFAETGTHLE